METVIKQTEESMTRKLSNASRLHEDYRPLKAEVDLLRRQYLGLDRLPDLHEEEGSPITPESVEWHLRLDNEMPSAMYSECRTPVAAASRRWRARRRARCRPSWRPRRRASRRRRRPHSGLPSTKISLPSR